MNKRQKWFESKVGYFFIFPGLLFMLIMIGYPMISNIWLSFKDVSVRNFANESSQHFIGLKNYVDLFTSPSAILPQAIINSLIFTVASILFQFIIGFAMAMFFKDKFRTSSFIRGIIMISWVIPITVSALLFKFMFGVNEGIINQLLIWLGIIKKPIGWLLEGKTAMIAIISANIWIGVPFNMILLLTGLTTIPNEVYESADIDGAGPIRRLFSITLPMIKPAIMSVLTLGFVYTFKVFDLVWVMTKGGPMNSTELVSTYAYRLSMNEFQFSKGAAAANVLFVILFIVGLFYVRNIGKDEVM